MLSIGSVVLAAWVSIDGRDGIAPATVWFATAPFRDGLSWSGPGVGVDGTTVAFWVLAGIWTRALFIRLREEDQAEARYREDLIGALYSLPNFNVLWNYSSYFDAVAGVTLGRSFEASRAALGEDIQVALAAIAEMARAFSRSPSEAYGASLMLVVRKEDIPRLPAPYRTPHSENPGTGRLRFVGDRPDVKKLDGLLVLPSDLAVHSVGDGGGKSYPLISLPIRYSPLNLVLPGAPRAVLNDQLSVYEDTRKLAVEHCRDFSEPTQREVHEYFGRGGEGADIRSLASIRLGSETTPLGVLSIDTNGTDVLGTDEDYYKTFYALLRPVLRLLEPLVQAYARAWWAETTSVQRLNSPPAPLDTDDPPDAGEDG